MKRYWMTSIVAMAAILGLSACAIKREPPSAGDVVDLNLYINGERLEKVLSDPEKTEEVLSRLVGKKFDGDISHSGDYRA